MKKTLITLGLVASMSGCANTGYVENTSMANYWHGPDKEQMTITGKHFQSASTFKLLINNKMVIDDKVSAMSGDGDFQGEYNGIPVTASCKFAFVNGQETCTITIDGNYAATLKFDGSGLVGW